MFSTKLQESCEHSWWRRPKSSRKLSSLSKRAAGNRHSVPLLSSHLYHLSILRVLAFSDGNPRMTSALGICNAARRVIAQDEILSTPLLRTLLSLPLRPFPKHFLFHLLPPKRFRSPLSTLRGISSPSSIRPPVVFLFAAQITLINPNLLDPDFLFLFMFPLLS